MHGTGGSCVTKNRWSGVMNLSEMDLNIVRYGELVPCKTAFIDAHTPGSDRKENFTIIGGGV